MSCLFGFIRGDLIVYFNYSFGSDGSKYSVRNVMNLLVPAVWYVVVTSTLAVQRQLHSHVKYRVTKQQNPNSKPSNPPCIEDLEIKFLRPKVKPIRKPSPQQLRLEHLNRIFISLAPSTAQSRLEMLDHHRFRWNSSAHHRRPNYFKRRRNGRRRKSKNRKYVKRSFLPKGFLNLFNPTQPPDDDFFGLFTTNCTSIKPIVEESFENETGKVTPYNPHKLPTKWCRKTEPTLNCTPRAHKSSLTGTQDSVIADKFRPSFGSPGERGAEHRIPPVNISKLQQSESKPLYIDRYENSKRDVSDFFSRNGKDDEQEDTPDEGGHGLVLEDETDETTIGDAGTESTTEPHLGKEISQSEEFSSAPRNFDIPDVYDKNTCEENYGKKCICVFKGLYGDYRKVFTKAGSRGVVLGEIGALTCKKYSPVKDQYALSAHIAPRLLSRNKKPLAINADKGPKELEPSSLEDTIRDIASQEDDITHVLINTDIMIPCFPTNDLHLSANGADQVTYKWTHGNKKSITDGRMVENADGEGTLMIQDVSITDSDNYTCAIDYINPDNGFRTEESFVHSVLVVALPTVTVRVTVHYRASVPCDPVVVEMFELYLPQQLEEDICSISSSKHLCRVEIHSPVCQTRSGERAERDVDRTILLDPLWTRDKREDSMEMSLNFEVYVHRSEEKALSLSNATLCGPKCHLLLYLRMLQLLHASMGEVALTPVSVDVKDNIGVFQPDKGSVRLKYIVGCIGGYHLDQGFCVPCPEHTFSEDGATECTACPPYTYQGNIGARKCIPCSSQWIPTCNEYFETVNISIILVIVGLVIISLCGFLVWYNVRVKHKKFDTSSFKRKLKLTKSKREKLGATQKIKKKGDQKSVQEMAQLLDSSEGETEANTTADELNVVRFTDSEPETMTFKGRLQ